MKLDVKCPECAAVIEQDLTLAGTLCSCPKCHSNYTAPATNVLPGSKLGDYWIQSKLGGSIRSDVFVAKDLTTGDRVVVKVLSPLVQLEEGPAQKYFSTFDARIFKDTPGIIQPKAVGVIGGYPYIAADLLQGEDLRSRLKRVGTFPESQLVHVARSCAETLCVVWKETQRYHGHIRPGNILLQPNHQVVFIDFGLDLLMHDADNAIAFDPKLAPYRSPEQNKGERGDFRSDMYSLGATLYYFATGAKPLAFGMTNSLLVDDDDTMMPPLREVNQNVSKGFSDVVSSLLQIDRDARPESWDSFLEMIDEFQASQLNTQILKPDPIQIRAALKARGETAEVVAKTTQKVGRRKKNQSDKHRREVLRRNISIKANTEDATPGWVVFLLLLSISLLGCILFFMAMYSKK